MVPTMLLAGGGHARRGRVCAADSARRRGGCLRADNAALVLSFIDGVFSEGATGSIPAGALINRLDDDLSAWLSDRGLVYFGDTDAHGSPSSTGCGSTTRTRGHSSCIAPPSWLTSPTGEPSGNQWPTGSPA
jgi:hypothetical protein